MEGDIDTRRSTTVHFFTIGAKIVSCILKFQRVVSLSKMEENYVISTEASKEMLWLHGFIEELGKK